MSEAAKGPSKRATVVVEGRLTQIRKAGKTFLHLVTLPAEDEFSSPATVEINAGERLGEAGTAIKVTCRIGGFRRQYRSTDQETGEQKTVVTADNRLYAV